MEDILDLYETENNSEYPIICVDEKPYQFLSDRIEPIEMKPGHLKKEDFEYEREGTCNIFMIAEPFNGYRYCKATTRRTKKDFAELLKDISDKYYPQSKGIRLVMDNLNTHKLSVLYEYYTPEEARRIIKRFEVHYTPVHGSWLNIAEIELSVMSKQCTKRRIPDIETLQRELQFWANGRNTNSNCVQWRFRTKDARIKLKKLYPSLLI